MGAVLGTVGNVLGMVSGVLGTAFGVLAEALELLSQYSAYLFICGFFGVLMAFLWFFFRYLDRKKLVLPTIMFTFFLLVLLGSGAAMVLREMSSSEKQEAPDTQSVASSGAETEGVRL